MKWARFVALMGVSAVCTLLLAGCGSKASESKPMAEVKSEADQMDVSQLRSMALAYKDAIMAKQKDVEKIAAQLKEIPLKDILGEESKKLKGEVDKLQESVKALSERFKVYAAKLKEKKGDLSGLEL